MPVALCDAQRCDSPDAAHLLRSLPHIPPMCAPDRRGQVCRHCLPGPAPYTSSFAASPYWALILNPQALVTACVQPAYRSAALYTAPPKQV